MKRYERDGQVIEVSNLRYSYHNSEPCYEMDGRGSIAFYLGEVQPLVVQEHRDGSWTIKYIPDNDNFSDYAQSLIRLNAWK
jgi:hypothetical protein